MICVITNKPLKKKGKKKKSIVALLFSSCVWSPSAPLILTSLRTTTQHSNSTKKFDHGYFQDWSEVLIFVYDIYRQKIV